MRSADTSDEPRPSCMSCMRRSRSPARIRVRSISRRRRWLRSSSRSRSARRRCSVACAPAAWASALT
ncbi:Uncharacterised protein [Bordetella pertussis]|nr:Uncharacterised protein [Bordetella pertussis]